MILVEETTFENTIYNHRYLLSDDKLRLYGFKSVGEGEDEMKILKPALQFFPKGRTFNVLAKGVTI
jgi:hypothetical protein